MRGQIWERIQNISNRKPRLFKKLLGIFETGDGRACPALLYEQRVYLYTRNRTAQSERIEMGEFQSSQWRYSSDDDFDWEYLRPPSDEFVSLRATTNYTLFRTLA